MSLLRDLQGSHLEQAGEELHAFASELFPICRSITGSGIRETLRSIQKRIPLKTVDVPTGTAVLDWTIPKEWNIRDAYIKDKAGQRIVDFNESNLHVVNYSVPVRTVMPLAELRPHLHTIPEHPDWVPYKTSYYKEDWGFCLSYNQMQSLAEAEYEVCIDSDLQDGKLTYGECLLPGRSTDEVLISCHVCHPSLANDNLSGLTVSCALAQFLAGRDLRYSYRFLFIPGTIGAITWLAMNRENVDRIKHGLVMTCVGDSGPFHYKKSRRGDAVVDRAAAHVLRHLVKQAEVLEFSPYGYDERQYCSPGFNLSVGCLMRSVWGTFPEYHSSADNMEFVDAASLAESLRVCVGIVDVLEGDALYQNLAPYGEPQLGKRDLYRPTGGEGPQQQALACLWVLNLSDSTNSLLDIAERSGMPFEAIRDAATSLMDAGLLSRISHGLPTA